MIQYHAHRGEFVLFPDLFVYRCKACGHETRLPLAGGTFDDCCEERSTSADIHEVFDVEVLVRWQPELGKMVDQERARQLLRPTEPEQRHDDGPVVMYDTEPVGAVR